uniref:ATP-dependent DNA helicase RecG n=1 Tax=candidate division WOR-3 bacterium TaxID=2052148 RepID=A0A7C4GFA1_UNCW3
MTETPIQYLKGVGPRRAELFGRIGVRTVRDLLWLVPRRYIDRSQMLSIRELRVGDEVTVIGRVVAVAARQTRGFRRLVSVLVGDGSSVIEAVWFNRPDLDERFRPNQQVMVSGRVTDFRGKRFVNPSFEVLEKGGQEFSGTNAIVPVYPLTEGLSTWVVRSVVRAALDRFGGQLDESLPRDVLVRYHFPDLRAALEAVHFPASVAAALKARERLVYEELFYLQLLLALRRRQSGESRKESPMSESGRLTVALRSSLGFSLTSAQERAIDEIRRDMASDKCMNRLLQGDVGSGKTVVAVYAMLIACENRSQAAMMVPTEILAEQHYRGWGDRLRELGVRAALLTGSTRASERRKILAGLEDGSVDIVFGTHALIEQGVRFRRLGLVVVDEQHRFGVMQRAALLAKGLNPDFLVMTATPIPRTLALTVYGDLDSSILGEKPAGRKPVVTRLVTESRRQEVYNRISRRLAAGEQVFVVCPLIEESEKLDLVSATEIWERTRVALPKWRVGLVHGRLRAEERNRLMEQFRNGELHVMVATPVIEVGVDVPNATVMLIEHPERFGLSQLHQLRGRIGRGEKPAYCILLVREAGAGAGEDTDSAGSAERLRFFARTSDGFALAEKDMELRGPGELLGVKQHGLPDLKVADILRDREALGRARADAFRLVQLDPTLVRAENVCVQKTLLTRFAGRAELLRVG